MYSTIVSAAICGINAVMVHVEVDMAQGLPCFMMVGYLGSEVKEAGERVRVALKNSGISIPPMRITVNLSPADIRKGGTAFDLPIALGILKTLGHIPEESTAGMMVVGELSLNGEINSVKGVLPLVKKAREEGITRCIVPEKNEGEGSVIGGMEVIGAATLKDTMRYLNCGGLKRRREKCPGAGSVWENSGQAGGDFREVNGQTAARRAAEIAAAGFHHMLLIGPPGSGKTMIAECIPGILPPLTKEEGLEVSAIYSVSGLLKNGTSFITKRPFIAPHHTATAQALAGGGRIPKPGMVSLAHKGVLFMDEMPEFKQGVLNMLRQPLEEKRIHIARLDGSYTYPADFMLVGAANPCPCGFYPDMKRCRCTSASIRQYQSHISGPVLDRIDICVEVPPVEKHNLMEEEANESSSAIRERVCLARELQEERYKGSGYHFNSGLTPGDMKRYCKLGSREAGMMEKTFDMMRLSARAYYRILRVARTIADLDGSTELKELHLSEAVSLRSAGEKYWEK